MQATSLCNLGHTEPNLGWRSFDYDFRLLTSSQLLPIMNDIVSLSWRPDLDLSTSGGYGQNLTQNFGYPP